MNLRENFDTALHLNAETGCLEWQRSLANKGYGQLYSGAGDRPVLAHRYAWERRNGPIPDGLCVCHRCDNPRCCNVDHLFLGTKADNNQDMRQKGRHFVPRTQRHEQHHKAKLSLAQVAEIRAIGASIPQRALAARYGVSQAVVGKILRNQGWTFGEPNRPVKRLEKVADNFDAHCAPDGACLIWQKGRTNGYGSLSVKGRPMYAHRFAWERNGGEVPSGFFLQHACANKLCVNPEHLRLLPKAGTQ